MSFRQTNSEYTNVIRVILMMSMFFLNTESKSQTPTLTPSIDNVVPPSPNVSAINKFGNIPVGQSTGIPNISVPVYSWSGKNFGKSFEIGLAYHNGGVKVNEMASNVGLGWALNAGGVISRTMRGVYDELPQTGFLYQNLPASSYDGNTFDVPVQERLFNKMNDGKVDTQNDIFSYSFNGRSGSFVLGRNGDILFLEQNKLKIEKFIDIINGKEMFSKFIITDEYGYRFVFQDYEISSRVGGSGFSNIFTSSWYLTSVYNPTGNDSIEFQYENTAFRVDNGGSTTHAMPLFADGYGLPADMSGGSETDISGKRLKKITFTDGNTVDFYYDAVQRQDLTGDFLLKKIKISKGEASHGVQLVHDYSLSGRATLRSVMRIGGVNDITEKPYIFEYFANESLPPRFSQQQDHWGYANWNNGGNLPHEYFPAPGGAFGAFREFGGGDRDTDPARILAGSMVRMTYPTGGYTSFEMEANTAKDNWLEQNETVSVNLPPFTEKSLNEPLNSDQYPGANIPFVFNGENNTTSSFEVTVNPLAGNCSFGCGIRFEIYNSSNGMLTSEQINFSDSANPYLITRQFNLFGLVKEQTYYFRAYIVNVTGYYDYISIKWKETNAGGTSNITLRHVQPYVGGLRAKKIIDVSEGQASKTLEYDYVNEDGVTSSGALGFRPVYTQLVRYQHKSDPTLVENPWYQGNFDYNYAIRSTSPVNEMAYAVGSPVTYKRVVETSAANGLTLGKTVRYFSNFSDAPPVVQNIFPAIPTQFASWAYGLLQREEFYSATGELVKKIEHSYLSHSDQFINDPQRVENFRSISIAPVRFLWHGSPFTPHVTPNTEPHYFLSSSFAPVSGRTELVQSITTELKVGESPLTSVVGYTYDQNEFYLKETSLINSKNQERKSVTEYAKDRIGGSNGSVFSAMYLKNMVKQSVGERQYLNGTELMSQRKDFANWSTGLYAPTGVYTQNQGYPEELRIQFLNYDVHGALVSVMHDNGVPMCYVWGYGGDHLLAKVSNADYASVVSALGGSQAVENFRNERNPSDASVNLFITSLRNLTSAQVESFTYNTLVGMTSMTDAKGMTTYYHYDTFGRLEFVKDQDGHIVKQNTYHYKN
ncbi:MAG: hypothetical protein EOO88_12925 [Pedobacter sp.]|nr:MAG: hypothetical protein EOO88_12925 [Pedobacter sp.]